MGWGKEEGKPAGGASMGRGWGNREGKEEFADGPSLRRLLFLPLISFPPRPICKRLVVRLRTFHIGFFPCRRKAGKYATLVTRVVSI